MSRLMVVLAVIWTIGFGLWFAFGRVYYSTAAIEACIPEPCSPAPVTNVENVPSVFVVREIGANNPPLLERTTEAFAIGFAVRESVTTP